MKRRQELSRLNVFFCLLVILIHCLSQPVSALRHDSLSYGFVLVLQRLCFTAVPGFFLLSGLKLTMGCREGLQLRSSLGGYYKKRFFRVLMPYLISVTVYVAYFLCLGWIETTPKAFAGYYLLGNICAHFYYVVVLVQFISLTPLWLMIVRKLPAAVGIPLSLVVTLFTVSFAWRLIPGFAYTDSIFPSYLCFFLTGCYLGKDYDRFYAAFARNPVWGVLSGTIFFLLAVGDGMGSLLGLSDVILPAQTVPGLNMVHQLYEGAGIFFFLYLTMLLGDRPLTPIGTLIDLESYFIYLYHIMFIQLFRWQCSAFIPLSGEGPLLILRCLFVYPAVILAAFVYRRFHNLMRRKKTI